MRFSVQFFLAITFLIAVVLVACGGGRTNQQVPVTPQSERTVVGPGDVFTMQIVGEKELPTEFQIASDGTVDLPYVQTLKVAGLEPQEIQRAVREQLIQRKILTNPIVIVQVKEYHSRRVTLLGQVAKPGSFALTPGLTLIHAISLAGGLTAIADTNKVNVTRKTGTGTKMVVISVDAIMEGRSPDIPLQAGDQIYVHERIF